MKVSQVSITLVIAILYGLRYSDSEGRTLGPLTLHVRSSAMNRLVERRSNRHVET